jgi:hypothetical protein
MRPQLVRKETLSGHILKVFVLGRSGKTKAFVAERFLCTNDVQVFIEWRQRHVSLAGSINEENMGNVPLLTRDRSVWFSIRLQPGILT